MPAHTNRPNDRGDEHVVDDTLRDLAIIEESLAYEVAQLMALHAPEKANAEQARYGGKPVWWWRFKLMMWTHAREVCPNEADDLLRGLRLSLKEWDDAELLRFLTQLGRVGAQRQQQRRGRSA